ncbi:ABC-three component system protein [Myroides odoratimimus]|uniref:ABC-three component system protein n=1 Tax=Myroides odoratimimus TaxID=76832 RepID=UPI0025757BC2|nr:ABC-three component system protein [Myroides odoratimimus]MDM1038373.1 hypothetical protein [Myroides odoratimimus]MDM1052654.1 hypothetical protein [Myroides odoratimimus]
MPTIEEQLRFFAVKVNNGSGCIFQPDSKEYTYILTVKHNLEITNGNEEKVLMPIQDIKIYRDNADGDPISGIVNYEVHDTLDLALIVIPYIGDSKMVLVHSNPIKNESIVLYGYPSRLSKNQEKRENVRCFCDMQSEDKLGTEIRTEQGQNTWDINTQKAMIGLSGCGVFAEVNGALVLKGIFPKLKDPSGANNKLITIYISNFNSIVDKLGLKHLIPSDLLSFNSYVEKAFMRIDPQLHAFFRSKIKNIHDKGITPITIAERNKEKLTIPVSKNYSDSLSQSKLWEAWLELLTFLNIAIPELQDLESCYNKVPLYFSANEHHIKSLLRLFLSQHDLQAEIKKNSLIVFSSIERSGGNDFLPKEKVKNIVANVDRSNFFSSGMMIDNALQIPEFSCIHVDHFSTKIDQIDVDNLQTNEILELIKHEIINILNYAS